MLLRKLLFHSMAPRTKSHFLLTVVFPAPWALVEERGLYCHHHRIHYAQEKNLYCFIVMQTVHNANSNCTEADQSGNKYKQYIGSTGGMGCLQHGTNLLKPLPKIVTQQPASILCHTKCHATKLVSPCEELLTTKVRCSRVRL